jgi:hypothetical protein
MLVVAQQADPESGALSREDGMMTSDEAKVAQKAYERYQFTLMALGCYPEQRDMLDFVGGAEVCRIGRDALGAIGETMTEILSGRI